jgi:histidinol-phosphate aminotransferase
MYGLGGLRIGWGYGSRHVIDILNRVRGPFNLSSLALAAANSALTDVEYIDRCRNENARLRQLLINDLGNLGIVSDTSHANFILARFKGIEEAQACYEFMYNEGLLVRQVTNYNLPHCLRITVGDETACERVYKSIQSFLENVR